MKKTNKLFLEDIIYLIGAIIILFVSFSPYFKTFKIRLILNVLLLPLAIFNIVILKKKINIQKKKIVLIVLIVLILLIQDLYKIIYLNTSMNNLELIINLVVICAYFISINKIKFYKILEKIILVLSSIGLIMYTFNFYNKIFFLKRVILKERVYFNFYRLYGYFEGRSHQNSGFTWEPSAWCILLGSILLFRLIGNQKLKCLDIILMINILTSQSTTGYVILILMFGYLLIKKISLKKMIFIVLIIFSILSSDKFRDKVYYKISQRNNYSVLKNKKFEVGSSAARDLHRKIDLEIFKNNIILGQVEDNRVIRKKIVQMISRKDKIAKYFLIKKSEYFISSNGLSYTLAKYGILIFLLYFYLYFESCLKNISLNKVLYVITMLFIFTVQEANWLPYFIMLIFMQNILLQKSRRNK